MKEKNILQFVLFSILAMAFIVTLFQLWEQDIFWQIKAGREILSTLHLQFIEQWSYTAFNSPWYNFQWLSTVLLALIYNVTNIEGLIFSRAILLILLLIIQVQVIYQSTRKNQILLSILLLPFFYSALVMRIQIRPEFLVIILHAYVLLVWTSDKNFEVKIFGSLVLIILATNLHPGVAPFLVLTSSLCTIASSLPFNKKVLFLLALALSFFITPYATHLFSFLQRHLFYQANTILPNPEYFPLGLNDFNPLSSSLYAYSWVLLSLIALYGFVRIKFSLYGQRILSLPIFVFLTILCIKSPRAIPFQMIFSFPIIVSVLDNFLNSIVLKRKFIIVLIVIAVSWEFIQIKLDPSPLGLSIFPSDTPKTTIKFLRDHRPSKNLFHSPAWGNYLLFALEEYPVFFDSREIPFDPIQKNARGIFENPELMKSFLNTYNVNTVLLPMGFFLTPYPTGAIRRAVFFPSPEWAVVSYDEFSILLLKRIHEHEDLIKRFEYKYVIPDLLPNLMQPDSQAELNRCRNENPGFAFCP